MNDPSFIKNMAERYGIDSNVYRVRVLGEFPRADEDAFLPLDLVKSAVNRDIQPAMGEPVIWGLDVARSPNRDRSALVKRQGGLVFEPPKTWRLDDAMELCGLIKIEYETLPPSMRPEYIFLDAIGVGGPVGDRLRQLELPAVDINITESPALNDIYYKLKDELWGEVRLWFNSRKCSIPDDEGFISELTTPKLIQMPSGKLRVERKDEIRRRFVRATGSTDAWDASKSPDTAEAFNLTFAFSGGAASGVIQNSNWRTSINEDRDTSWVI